MTQTTGLHGYAERLLAGTGIRPEDASAVASAEDASGLDVPGRGQAAAEALRDGWAAAQLGGMES